MSDHTQVGVRQKSGNETRLNCNLELGKEDQNGKKHKCKARSEIFDIHILNDLPGKYVDLIYDKCRVHLNRRKFLREEITVKYYD